ncbi:hypothetical protein LRS11_18060 [Pseudomonas sp. J452]|uniref:hypothetical protein n=1 Tax=Pseudomonas sp. J452 TaxID=2898441 RepID=UPI0021AE2482|nr:hypothetical protein [Pseudomonas sp. J452]UUY10693.1 hypothetical protein LRS11_18060 [Pseudomonas sp. J452]
MAAEFAASLFPQEIAEEDLLEAMSEHQLNLKIDVRFIAATSRAAWPLELSAN